MDMATRLALLQSMGEEGMANGDDVDTCLLMFSLSISLYFPFPCLLAIHSLPVIVVLAVHDSIKLHLSLLSFCLFRLLT